jgi:hypothetical protein
VNIFFVFSLVSGNSHAAKIAQIIPGSYDNTLVAFDPVNKRVTGYFSQNSPDETRPFVRCAFYFAGKMNGSTAKLKIYQLTLPNVPDSGSLRVEQKGKERTINLQLDKEQPGCMNIYPKAELAKTRLAIISPANWIEIRMAAEKKVYFFKGISPDVKTGIYITKGDVVGVLEYRGDWANVVYMGETKSTTGWVKVSQLLPSVPASLP